MVAFSHLYDTPQPDRIAVLTGYLARYTGAELAYVLRELPYDAELAKKRRFGGHLGPSDFERIARKRADLICKLDMPITERQMYKLIEEWPRDLHIKDFGCCGYDSNNYPMYRYTGIRRKYRPPQRFEVRGGP